MSDGQASIPKYWLAKSPIPVHSVAYETVSSPAPALISVWEEQIAEAPSSQLRRLIIIIRAL